MNRLLAFAFTTIVRHGALTVIDAGGKSHSYGDGTGGAVVIRLRDKATERDLVLDPELRVGEAYMDGRLVIEKGTTYDFLALMMENMAAHPLPPWSRLSEFARRRMRFLSMLNTRRRARRNAAHHYDVDPRIYRLFLDRDMQYSCAYFNPAEPVNGDGLDDAQLAKKRHIAAKLNVAPRHRVLDIGCGWGGLALYLNEICGAYVRGITLSNSQYEAARDRARHSHADRDVTFAIEDYRETTGTFDRVVSVGMLEHVGPAAFDRFFSVVSDRLNDDGVALIHTIARSDDAGGITNPFLTNHIFPGGYIPALSELMASIERSGLVVGDIEVLRLHYALTLRRWRQRFAANRDKAVAIAGERFCRMWEFYLAGSEASFRYQNLVVLQIQLVRKLGALPATRAYISANERKLKAQETPPHGPQIRIVAGR
ncbi:MAG: class I SAM-dependent methyltransferase [Hyphomicrobiaceae bacterium]